jgi:phosphatidylserine decarboxylase
MLLTRYGLREWGLISLLAAALAAVSAWAGWPWLILPISALWLAAVSFFRDPLRHVPTALPQGTMLSPADGRVSRIEVVERHEALAGEALVIRIFLSVLNVHVNRSPYDGEVISTTHRPGRYLDARSEESARVNESVLTLLSIDGGERLGIKQISGAIARRIVCPIAPGDRLVRGQRFGMIKFGSTTELILPRPSDVEVLVREGDAVRGGLTPLARLRPRADTARQA